MLVFVLQVTQSLVDHLNTNLKAAIDKADDAEAEAVQVKQQVGGWLRVYAWGVVMACGANCRETHRGQAAVFAGALICYLIATLNP